MMTKQSHVSSRSPEFALLGLLAQQPAHGYELHQRLAENLGQIWHISQSQTYSILNRLEARGLIEGLLQKQDKLPARKQFHLTPKGQQRLLNWLYTTSRSSVHAIRVEFLTRLYFVQAIAPERLRKIIAEQEDEIRVGLDRLQKIRSDLPPDQVFNILGLDLRIQQLESLLDWLDDCRSAITMESIPNT